MSLSKDDARARIRAAGLRTTSPRIAVVQLLADAARPLTHTEVVERLGDDDWDQATLYRNLVKLTEAGVARVGSQAAGQRRYELVGNAPRHLHPHFVCNDCGAVACLPEVTVTQPTDLRWQSALEAAELHFVGRCPPCAAS